MKKLFTLLFLLSSFNSFSQSIGSMPPYTFTNIDKSYVGLYDSTHTYNVSSHTYKWSLAQLKTYLASQSFLFSLTNGYGITGSAYNGSAAQTWKIDTSKLATQYDISGFGSGTVTSVSGTTNRITSTGGTTPVIDISGSYVGQSSITTLGTIGTGTWQGTAVGATYGGTGINTSASTGIGQVSAGTWSISTGLTNGTTATTQTAFSNDNKVATDAYVDTKAVMSGTFGNSTTLNPADATTYFWGTPTTTVPTTGAGRRLYVTGGNSVRVTVWVIVSGTLASNESVSIYVRKNNTTDATITTTDTWDTANHGVTGTATLSLSAGDYVELKVLTPTWGTNPTTVQLFGTITIF